MNWAGELQRVPPVVWLAGGLLAQKILPGAVALVG